MPINKRTAITKDTPRSELEHYLIESERDFIKGMKACFAGNLPMKGASESYLRGYSKAIDKPKLKVKNNKATNHF